MISMSIEYKLKPTIITLSVKCPKLDEVVDVEKYCKTCRFFAGMTFGSLNVCCQYESDKL